MNNFHYFASNAMGWSVDADSPETAIAGLQKTNGYSDKLLGYSLFKVLVPLGSDYIHQWGIPKGVDFNLLHDDDQLLKSKDGSPIPTDEVINLPLPVNMFKELG